MDGRFNGLSVLVAEDNIHILGSIAAFLEHEGAQVVCAENGREALDQFQVRSGSFDIILMDLEMPVLSGDGALHKIRALNLAIPVIVMSGSYGADKYEAMDRVHLIKKPFQFEDLRLAIGWMLGNGRCGGEV